MVCIRCGGEINPAGRCTVCGMLSEETSGASIVRSIDELAEHYGLTVTEDSEALPTLFSGYDDKLTRKAKVMQEAAVDNSEVPSGKPTIGLSEYAKLLGVDSEQDITPKAEIRDEPDAQETPVSQASPQEEELSPILQRVDRIIAKPADKVLNFYYSRHPRPARAQQRSEASERLMVAAAAAAALLLIALLAVIIFNSIAPDITGEWLISETSVGERLTIEFTKSHDVTVRVYSSGENVYQTGRYKIRRSNGYNLLTINYDDGTERRLYYTLDHDSGTFTNVDTNNSDEYTRID